MIDAGYLITFYIIVVQMVFLTICYSLGFVVS